MPRICCGISIRRFQGEQLNAKARRCEEEKLCVSVPLRLCVEREFLMSTERVSSGAVSSNSPVANTAFATTAFDRLRILEQYRTIAMVGLSSNPFRPSHFAAIYMLAEGYRIIPEKVEIVDIFREPGAVPPIVEDAIAIGAKVVWMQLGVINEAAAQRARAAGLAVVMDACVKIEHARFFGGLSTIGLNTGVISARRMQDRK